MPEPTSEEVTIVVPCRNEEATLEKVIRECWETCSPKMQVRFLAVDDDSDDGTPAILSKLARSMPLKVVRNDSPLGFGGALTKGISLVSTPWVAFNDADGQYYPEDLNRLFEARDGADRMITGWRVRRADPKIRTFISLIFQIMNRVAFRLRMKDITTSLKLGRTDRVQEIAPQVVFMNGSFWTEFMVRWVNAGYSYREVQIRHKPRANNVRSKVFETGRIGRLVLHQFVGFFRLFTAIRGSRVEGSPLSTANRVQSSK
jgi:glycosyltransferase involved in cell wall biosynthesis